MQSIRDWLYKLWIPCNHQLRSAPTAQNGMRSAALKHDVRRHPALCCGSVGFQLTVCVVSAGCDGLRNGTLLQERVVKWPSAPVRHSRSHYTSPEDHWAVSHFRAVAWCFPRCKRGGLVGEDAKQFDNLTRSSWVFAQRSTSKHRKTKSLRHNWITVLTTLNERLGSCEGTDCMQLMWAVNSTHIELILTEDWIWIKSGPPGPPSAVPVMHLRSLRQNLVACFANSLWN